jgi:hypothetical protein
MERQVLFRDRQELQAADLSNIESDVDESAQHLIEDAITRERQTVGLTVSRQSATELGIAAGRLWVGDQGKVYSLASPQTVSIFNQLPVTDERWLAVSCYGQEVDTDIQPRDFLIDLATGQTEPRAVAMERDREVVTVITAGQESPEPQKPAQPTGYTLLAYVLLTPAGVDTIINNSAVALPQLFDTDQRLQGVEAWRDKAAPAIATLSTDVAALAQATRDAASQARVNELAGDVARLKDISNLPATFSSYSTDRYLSEDGSATTDVDYRARIDEGVRFPWDAQDLHALQLFNPLETALINQNGLLLPPYTETPRLSVMSAVVGSIALSQYQYQTLTLTEGVMSRTETRYGPTRVVCTNSSFWLTGQYDPIQQIFTRQGETFRVLNKPAPHTYVRLLQFWTDTISDPYWYSVAVDHAVSGSLVTETILIPYTGWLTSIGLLITARGADGVVNLALCETKDGLPDLTSTVASTSLAAANLKLSPTETVFTFPRPVFLVAGKRYALAVITTGAHQAAAVDGNSYTQGTLFYSTDGAYLQGDLTKDLAFKLYYATFSSQFVQVQLQPLSLSGGIGDIVIQAGQIVPDTTTLQYEYQLNGVWSPIDGTTGNLLLGLPSLLPFRLTMVGTADLMPGLEIQGSTIHVARPAQTYEHISTVRTLPQASTQIQVQVLLEGWDAARHTCLVRLRNGATVYTAASVADTVVDAGSIRRTATFTISSPGISTYQILITGTTNNALVVYHVAERLDVAI